MNYEERVALFEKHFKYKDGFLYWKETSSGRTKVGSLAGTINKGFHVIALKGKTWPAHNIIYEMCVGDRNGATLDHIDGDRLNNAVENLEVVVTLSFQELLEKEGSRQALWRKIFDYKDGRLYRKSRHTQFQKPAGTPNGAGYMQVCVAKKYFRAGRVIWEYHNGEIPADKQIDHISTDGTDDRIENLRLATSSENLANRNVAANSITGVKGVSPYNNKFVAYIAKNGVTKNLGYFDSIEDAKKAYDAEAFLIFGEFARA